MRRHWSRLIAKNDDCMYNQFNFSALISVTRDHSSQQP